MSAKITLPHHSVVAKWKEEKVIKWLQKVQLTECIPLFEIRHIDGAKLLELNEQKLFTYQDMKIKHRKQIAKCVQECKSQASDAKAIEKTLKNSQSNTLEVTYESEDGFDDWGSDFEDNEDNLSVEFEVNNNTPQAVLDNEVKCSISEGLSIPKPPDVSVVPKANAAIFRNPNYFNGNSKPPLKRPPTQPPPPPQAQGQKDIQEDYEIPIVSSSANILDSSARQVTVIETYELVDGLEENYEVVDPPQLSNLSEKPILPPRYLKYPESVSPPPLPQKPLKLKEVLQERSEGEKAFCRPRLPMKSEAEAEMVSTPNMGFISTLMGRRPSITPPSSSPKMQHLDASDGPTNTKLLNGSQLSLSSSSDKEGQNMATRPLPPVPTPKREENVTDIVRDIQQYPWFQEMEREEAEAAIRKLSEAGCFVVRPSKRAGKENPYSLTVWHEGRLFHLNIRQRSDNTFALGKEKEKEKTFSSVAELITYHQNEPILLKNRGEAAGKTKLCKFPEKSS